MVPRARNRAAMFISFSAKTKLALSQMLVLHARDAVEEVKRLAPGLSGVSRNGS